MLCVLYYHVMEVMITVAFAVGIVADQHLVLNQIKSIQLLKGIIVILSFQVRFFKEQLCTERLYYFAPGINF